MKQRTVYIGLESNMGDRVAALRSAVLHLQRIISIQKVSRLYVDAPTGHIRDDATISAAVCGATQLKPMILLRELQRIERALGRPRGVRFGRHQIDLDILFYDSIQIDTPLLTIPHPRITQRASMLKPLAEIEPTLVHPALYYTVSQLLYDADDVTEIIVYKPPQ